MRRIMYLFIKLCIVNEKKENLIYLYTLEYKFTL